MTKYLGIGEEDITVNTFLFLVCDLVGSFIVFCILECNLGVSNIFFIQACMNYSCIFSIFGSEKLLFTFFVC